MSQKVSMAATPVIPSRALWLVLLAAGGTFAITMGVRQTMGLFIGSINTHTALGLGAVSLAFGVAQLWWGLMQPLAGLVADRWGPGRMVLLGVLLVALGTALVPHVTSMAGLIFAIAILGAGGAGMAGPAVLMAASTRLVAPAQRGLATGVVNAAGSFGQFVFAPLAQTMSNASGWVSSLHSLALISLLALPAAWALRGLPRVAAAADAAPPLSSRQAIAQAFATPSYRLLATGFFVCGFHVAFLATHLPGVVASCGLTPQVGAWAVAVLGLFNIVGSVGIGWAMGYQGGRWRMKSMLSLLYTTRAVAVLLFVLAPKSTEVVLVFAAVMGMTFLSTVPLTAGLVARFFGPAHMATLFGMVMVTHQIGGFLGAWLGGKVFEATGSYEGIWIADIALALGAALIHLPIKESRPTPAPQMA
jgi:predicted MFS family arabinose efflux permease